MHIATYAYALYHLQIKFYFQYVTIESVPVEWLAELPWQIFLF